MGGYRMAVTVTYGDRFSDGSRTGIPFNLTFDSSYVTGGEEITASNFGLDRFESIDIEDSEGYTYDVDIATGGATANIKAYYMVGSNISTTEAITLTDSNTAETDGVQVYVHTKDGKTAWLEFVSPTDADATGTLSNGGSDYFIFDSDSAATDGVELYFDEDATVVDERLMCVSPSNNDLYVPISGTNKFIKIKDNDTAATDGVGVFCDENASNTYGRLLYISPTNTDGTGSTDDEYVPLAPFVADAALTEVDNATDLSSISIDGVAYGR
jgi:hypothetical protein